MSALNAEQRGDMVEALLPEAAGLVVDVHEGSADDIRTRLHGLTRHELEGLAVVLAALANPDHGLKDALGWIDFDENGDRLRHKPRCMYSVRDVVPVVRQKRQDVDMAAVERALSPGARVPLNMAERRLAVEVGIRRGLSYDDLSERLGMGREAVKRAWERAKCRARAEGRRLPPVAVGEIRNAA